VTALEATLCPAKKPSINRVNTYFKFDLNVKNTLSQQTFDYLCIVAKEKVNSKG